MKTAVDSLQKATSEEPEPNQMNQPRKQEAKNDDVSPACLQEESKGESNPSKPSSKKQGSLTDMKPILGAKRTLSQRESEAEQAKGRPEPTRELRS